MLPSDSVLSLIDNGEDTHSHHSHDHGHGECHGHGHHDSEGDSHGHHEGHEDDDAVSNFRHMSMSEGGGGSASSSGRLLGKYEVGKHSSVQERNRSKSQHPHAAHSCHGHSHGPASPPALSPRSSRGLPHCQGLTMLSPSELAAANQHASCQLWAAAGLCCVFMVAEFVGGYIANSLAVQTDAAHLLSDLASFMISIAAISLAAREPEGQLSYGYHRYEVIGALCSVVLIWLLTLWLAYQAVLRVINPQEVSQGVRAHISSKSSYRAGLNIAY